MQKARKVNDESRILMETNMQSILSGFGLGISLASPVIALLAYLIIRRQLWANALFAVVDRLETEEMRRIRHSEVYLRSFHEDEEQCKQETPNNKAAEDIDRWGTEMDLLGLLFFSRQLDVNLFFDMYGDVIIRSAFKLAPYGNRQRLIRGEQFWLAYQKLSLKMIQMWTKRSKRGTYPQDIGIPSTSERLNPDTIIQNAEMCRFLSANGVRL